MVESPEEILKEVRKCRQSVVYFIDTYCQVLSESENAWVPFRLWPAQEPVLDTLEGERQIVILKARQLGFTWVVLGYVLWLILFRPIATVLLFSKRDDEAVELLDLRLKEMHRRLPSWLQVAAGKTDGKHDWLLANGSRVKAFPTTGGRSYTGSFVLVDEADFVPDLNVLLNAVKPTVDAGGKLVLLSTADKSRPQSLFKRIYRAAKAGENTYRPIFHGWRARPDRDDAWYERQSRDCLANTGSLDDLHQEYPATDEEALAPRSLDKRIAPEWVRQCYRERTPLAKLPPGAPSIPDLTVYNLPVGGRAYVVGADPAEGNPTSDESALAVLDALTGEEVATLAGRIQPTTLAQHLDAVGRWYNGASVLVERNNHGHAVLLWLESESPLPLLIGHDGRTGWLSSVKGKAILYGACADAFRHRETILHSFATLTQLQSIEGSTLRAPQGEHDDRADAYALALVAARAVLAQAADDSEEMAVVRT